MNSNYMWMNADRNIADIPVATRASIAELGQSLINPKYYVKLRDDKLIKARTSGSSGQFIDVWWDYSDYHASMMELWIWRMKFYEIYPHSRLCSFYSGMYNNDEYIYQKNELCISKNLLTRDKIESAYNIMLEWNPEWLLIQPSTAAIICEYVASNKARIPDGLKYIELTGETLDEELRELIKRTFECNIANQYGANEVNSIAYECPNGNMHVMESNVLIEILDEDNNRISSTDLTYVEEAETDGRIVVTSRTNKAMPFIRYDIGDRGRLYRNRPCNCGCRGVQLELKSGRNSDCIKLDNNEKRSPFLFVRYIEKVNNIFDNIINQFYFEQISVNEFDVKLRIDEEFDTNEIETAFMEAIDDDILSRCNYRFTFTDKQFDINGKYIYFKRR